MQSEEIFRALLSIEKMIQGPTFDEWRKEFVDRNVQHFSFEDENKLIYTDIHKEYEEGVEKLIEQSLPPGTEMEQLMMALPEYLESSEAHREETARTVKLLLEIGDFKDFREMMLYAKRQKEEESEGGAEENITNSLSGGGSVFEVGGLIDMCGLLAETGAKEEGWVTVYTNKWMRIDKKPVDEKLKRHKNEIFLRGVMTLDLSYKECLDMFLFFGDRRREWDTNFRGYELPMGGDAIDDDEVVLISKLDFGTLMHMVGIPRSLQVKYIRRWDFPRKGSVSTAMVPWDVENNSFDEKSKVLSLKTNTIMPHPELPDKSIITTLEINRLGGMPKWALNLLMTATAPQLVKGLEQRYIAKIRKSGKTLDMTPEGRAKRAKGAETW